MPQNIFKLYDGRVNFWQWETKQKLIVLDSTITEVHFSNRDMSHSITKYVYEKDGVRMCDVPDILLQLPRNLIASACANGLTVKSVKFAVVKRPIPNGYVVNTTEEINEINRRLELLESMLKDIELGNQKLHKFESVSEARQWASDTKNAGAIVAVHIGSKWIAHMVEDDYSVMPICNCSGEAVEVDVYDGGDADGYNESEEVFVSVWDGGGAAGY